MVIHNIREFLIYGTMETMQILQDIVESWEPVYKEDKTVQLLAGDILEMLGLQYDPEIKIKLL